MTSARRRRPGRSAPALALGFVGDVGDLVKLVQARAGVRDIEQLDERLAHELGDCVWSILVLAERCDVDLEQAFAETMDELDGWLSRQLVG